MSYGALSHAAQSALNWGAKMGNFYHNTGEGGVSPYHGYANADVVWNVGIFIVLLESDFSPLQFVLGLYVHQMNQSNSILSY